MAEQNKKKTKYSKNTKNRPQNEKLEPAEEKQHSTATSADAS